MVFSCKSVKNKKILTDQKHLNGSVYKKEIQIKNENISDIHLLFYCYKHMDCFCETQRKK